MQITLSPVASAKTTKIEVSGLVLTIDGAPYDLGLIPQGGVAEAAEGSPFNGTVSREKVTIRYEYESCKAENNQPTDFLAYTVEVSSGEVPCPIIWRVES